MRSQAEVIGALLAVVAIVIIVFYVMNTVVPSLQRQVVESSARRLILYEQRLESLNAIYDTLTGTLKVNNTGAVPVRVIRIWYRFPNGTLSFVSLASNPLEIPVGGGIKLSQAMLQSIGLPSSAIPVLLVTARGNTFPVKLPQEIIVQQAERASVATALEAQPVTALLNAESIDDLLNSSDVYLPPQLLEEPNTTSIANGLVYGMVRYDVDGNRYGLVLVKSYEHVYFILESYLGDNNFIDVEPNEYLTLSAAYIGLTPNKGKPVNCYADNNLTFNMLLVGPGIRSEGFDYPKIYIVNESTRITASYFDLKEFIETHGGFVDPNPWRIKIIGFKPVRVVFYYDSSDSELDRWVTFYIDDPQSLCNHTGLWWLYGLNGVKIKVYLEGYAERIEIYATSSLVDHSNYAPYTIVMDVDHNGIPEIVFTDEDGYTAPACGWDDTLVKRFFIGYSIILSALDYSQPMSEVNCSFAKSLEDVYGLKYCPLIFFINGTNYAVNGEKYSMVLIAARIYYHDSEGGDVDCVKSPKQFMVGFFLVDPGEDGVPGTADDQIVSSHMYMYQQLDDWEDTWPPNVNFVSVTATLLVPNVNKNFYVAIGFVDPYNGTDGYDDVEFTAAIEVEGLAFFARG